MYICKKTCARHLMPNTINDFYVIAKTVKKYMRLNCQTTSCLLSVIDKVYLFTTKNYIYNGLQYLFLFFIFNCNRINNTEFRTFKLVV